MSEKAAMVTIPEQGSGPEAEPPDPGPTVLRDCADAETHVGSVCFKHGPPRLLGVELEWLLHRPPEPRSAPDAPPAPPPLAPPPRPAAAPTPPAARCPP